MIIVILLTLIQYFTIQKMSSKPRRIGHTNNFIEKLMKLLQDPNCQPYIHWIQSEDGFNITNVTGFTQNVLPVYYKHQNFSSFVRQLNMYGFTKIRGKEGDNIYQNSNLKRGSKTSVKKIQRRLPSPNRQSRHQIVLYNQSRQISTLNQIQKVKEKQYALEQKCIDLIEKNKNLLEQNEQIVKAIRNQEKKRQRLITQILQILNSLKQENANKNQQLAIQNKQDSVGDRERGEDQQEFNEDEMEKPMHFLDPQEEFLKLQDFLNIDYEEASDGFKL